MRLSRPVNIDATSFFNGLTELKSWEKQASDIRTSQKEVVDDPCDFLLGGVLKASCHSLAAKVAFWAEEFHQGRTGSFVFDEFVGPAASQGSVDLGFVLKCKLTSDEFVFAMLRFEEHVIAMRSDLQKTAAELLEHIH